MGYDINIISMNLSKAGYRKSYLRQLLDGENPDLCLLPGDNDDLKKSAICEYEQYFTQGNEQTVLLYKPNQIRLKWSPVNVNNYQQLPGTNFDLLVCPEAEVELGPYKEPKRFSILTWHFSLTREFNINRTTQAENIIRLSQAISVVRNIPTLIGGDFNMDVASMKKIVKHLSSEAQQGFIKQATESGMFPQQTWLPSMVNGTLTPHRHLIAMQVFACEQQHSSIVAQYGVQNGYQQDSDFFVASKSLVLRDPTLVDFGSATGRKTKVEKCEETKTKPAVNGGTSCYTPTYVQNYAPTKTIMSTEPRPPKHSGG